MSNWSYVDNSKIVLTNKVSAKKITGTRFATVLGYNRWSSPFQVWCELTKAAQLPFEDNKYTLAGKAIEPKLVDFMRKEIEDTVLSPEEYFGNNWNPQLERYGFYDDPVFNGKWDAAVVSEDGKTIKAIVECKTTSRRQDWVNGVPVYYAMQTALYAALSGVDWFYIVVSYLNDGDYAHPELFEPTEDNTEVFAFKTSDFMVDGKNIDQLMSAARDFYYQNVLKGISPEFNEDEDKEYLDILRTAKPENDSTLDEMSTEWAIVNEQIEVIKKTSGLAELEKKKKALTSGLKSATMDMLDGVTTKVVYNGIQVYTTTTKKLNEERVASLLTPEQLESCYDESMTVTVRKAKKGEIDG